MKSHFRRILSSPVFITAFAFALRMIVSYVGSRTSQTPVQRGLPFGFELCHVAKAIAAGQGFSSPLRMVDTGPTIWFTPIYPYLIAGIFKIWGIYTDTSRIIIQTMNCAFASLTIIPIHAIAKRTFGEGAAVASAWIWVFLPAALYYPIVWVWDTAFLALIFSLIFWVTLEMRAEQSLLHWVAYGLFWGLAVLINPSILSILPFFVGWLVWEAQKARIAWVKPVIAALLLFGICLVPWTIRNYRVFGKFIVLRSNFGLELWLGNNPEVTDTIAIWQHPDENKEEAEKYQRMGEIAYMAEKEHEALAYIRTHPGDTLNLIFRRFEITWLTFSDSPADVWTNGSLNARLFLVWTCLQSLLCLLGALFISRTRNPEAFPFAITLLVFPLIFYVTHTDTRYRFPIDPIILILATGAAAHLLSLAINRNPDLKKSAAPAPSLPAL
jgi:4-amino-4-deoxy-L-arabinose transferase-like glycosyltransferase